MPTIRRALRLLLTPVLALVLLFEEWGWELLAGLLARLARLPLWAWLERRIERLPPWAALLIFGLPVLALVPIKLLAVYLFGTGHKTLGLMLLLGAKGLGTAVVARLFQLTQPALMKLDWFARWYPRWKDWKDRLLDEVRQTSFWRQGRRLKAHLKRWWGRVRERVRRRASRM
ncbi:hypothetical protein [Variovorax terrae]|uniref:Transmembrane protein n=1 Tax=Variovorax terrae TaxID=2923278 RepID=A0A9X2APB2_9BURK|nr:hypothetical protein [Variovorax terrae]MCJ0763297.1 hypothetical protein [Variovorax terrae]